MEPDIKGSYRDALRKLRTMEIQIVGHFAQTTDTTSHVGNEILFRERVLWRMTRSDILTRGRGHIKP
jgi:hypothetical protein